MSNLEDNLIALHGERARVWLKALPVQLEKIALRHALTIQSPYANLSFHYVAPALCADGSAVVLKYGFDLASIQQEAAVLEAFSGQGVVRCEWSDPDSCYLLLQQLSPGQALSQLTCDDEAMGVAAELILALNQSDRLLSGCQSMADNQAYFEKRLVVSTIRKRLLTHAVGLLGDLLRDSHPVQLIHGDLHHDNILQSGDFWCGIDPKGVIAEPMVELGALLRNPISAIKQHPSPSRLIKRRLDILCERLGYDPKRAAAWAFIQSVLSACWIEEDQTSGLIFAVDLAREFAECL